MQMALMTDWFLAVRQAGWISFYQFVSLLSTIFSSSSGRSEQIIKIRRPANLKRHYGNTHQDVLRHILEMGQVGTSSA